MYVIILGPAGAGKTTMARALSEYGFLINLDPATPCEANVDIRKWVKAEEIQKNYSLGINGALLKSMEIISNMDEWIVKDKDKIKIVDTPGQLDIFLHHDYGIKIVKKLAENDIVSSVFVIDANEILSVENYLAMLALNAIVNLRLSIPSISVINKIDMVDVNQIKKFFDKKYLDNEIKRGDAIVSLASGLIDYIEYTSIYSRPVLASAKNGEGIEELYDLIHEIHCSCGEL
ncbi:MAG: ATP/GTP-binding protein [Thermoplasmatales archaeon]|nr:ATP/GTP-binding protein [Thermoplasmatales archaeon]